MKQVVVYIALLAWLSLPVAGSPAFINVQPAPTEAEPGTTVELLFRIHDDMSMPLFGYPLDIAYCRNPAHRAGYIQHRSDQLLGYSQYPHGRWCNAESAV